MKPAMRVASPRHSGNTPVAAGSSVPVWPTLRVLSAERTCRTTSNDVGPAGLSITRTPFIGSKHNQNRRLPPFLLFHFSKEAVNFVTFPYSFVECEEDLRRYTQLHPRGHLSTNKALGRIEAVLGVLALCV